MSYRLERGITLIGLLVLFSGCGGGGGGTPAAVPPPANIAPVANNQTVATDPETAISGTLTGSDSNGDSLTFAVVTAPGSGSLAISGNANQDYEYTPNTGFVGADTFTFTASDGLLSSAAATVSINVNSKPIVTGTSIETSEIASVEGAVSVSDAENDIVSFSISRQPGKGVVSNLDSATGVFTYTPNSNQDGVDTFDITASDNFQSSAPATITVEIFKWSGTQQFGTTSDDRPTRTGLFRTSDGGFVFGGFTQGQMSSTPLDGLQDAWIRKVDRRGVELWTVQFGDTDEDNARVIVPDPNSDDIFVIANYGSQGGGVVYRFDKDGVLIFSSTVDFLGLIVSTGADNGNIDANGDLYVTGWHDLNSSVVTKIDGSNGNTLWQRVLEGTGDNIATPFDPEWGSIYTRSIDFDSSGNVVIAGLLVMDAGAASRPCDSGCAFAVIFDGNGTLQDSVELVDFENDCGRSGPARLWRLNVAPDQTLWALGYGANSTGDDAFGQVTRFSADGTQILWSHCDLTGIYRSLYTTPIKMAFNGDGLVYGIVNGEKDNISPFYHSSELIITRLDPDGNQVFRTVINDPRADGGLSLSYAADITEGSQGLLYITGATDAELVSGNALGEQDAFIMRLDAAGDRQ